jgi:hypothetical protein
MSDDYKCDKGNLEVIIRGILRFLWEIKVIKKCEEKF